MINITEDELKKLERIKQGEGGVVYRKDDKTAYKIYLPHVVDRITWQEEPNPSLSLPKRHFSSLIERSKKLQYSGGVLDTINLDGKFRGVSIPFYEGTTLDDQNIPLRKRLSLSRQMVRNSQELTAHLIYPTDYKLNNVMLSDDEIKFIDLDDVKTHVCYIPNPLFRSLSICSLGSTIQIFLKQTKHLRFSKKVEKQLEREDGFAAFSYGKINDYLDEKEEAFDVLYFNSSDVLKLAGTLSAFRRKKLVMMIEEDELHDDSVPAIVELLKANGVTLYDIILRKNRDNYPEIENIEQAEQLSEGLKLEKVFKRSL